MSGKKRRDPPLDWLKQSVWAGEELPDELELLEAAAPAKTRPKPAREAAPAAKPPLKRRNRSHT